MSFYSAACYVFAYGWGQGQPILLSDLPIGSKYSRTLFFHTLWGALSIRPPLADRLHLPLLDLALCRLTQTSCGSAGDPTDMVKTHAPCPSATGVATN